MTDAVGRWGDVRYVKSYQALLACRIIGLCLAPTYRPTSDHWYVACTVGLARRRRLESVQLS